LYPRIGPRRLAMVGTLGVTIVSFMFVTIGLDTSQWTIRALMFTRGVFMGFIFIPIQTAAFANIHGKDTGRASALSQAQRQIPAGVGVAVIATVLIERLTSLASSAPNNALTPELTVEAFHAGFIAAGVLCIIGFVSSCFLHDEDAASTMRPPQE